jgi:ERCC4-related helicase
MFLNELSLSEKEMEGENQGAERVSDASGSAKIALKGFQPRLYQETIFSTASTKNTLIVLPTGLGKTAIALMLAVQRLNSFPNSKIVMLSPTKPLAEQHLKSFKRFITLPEEQMAVFTGLMSPEKRQALWKKVRFVSSTPQGLENDAISNKIDISEVSLLIFDEAHRAVGDYSYAFIAGAYEKRAKFPRILALTASPGSTAEKIKEVCKNLSIEAVEIRSESDPDVKPYVQNIDIEWVNVELTPEFLQVVKYLKDCFNSKIDDLNRLGYLGKIPASIGRKDLIMLQGNLHSKLAAGEKDYEAMQCISVIAQAMKVQHALELIETQGIQQLREYFEKLQEDSESTKVKAVKNLVADANFKSAIAKTRIIIEKGLDHPKVAKLNEIILSEVSKKKTIKIIIFTQYRDSATRIIEELSKIPEVTPNMFVGQAKRKNTGMNQKEQKAMLEKFSNGDFNTLVATSIGEEGLDIPQVDIVVFYEPVPSAIRTIQRRGRTGRQEAGRVIMLVTKNTRDEIYRWSAFYKEKRMKSTLSDLKTSLSLSGYLAASRKEENEKRDENARLSEFNPEGQAIKMIVDCREKGSLLLRELSNQGVYIVLENLDTADYVLSSRVAAEIKRVPDFVDSIIDGRLLSQLKSLKESYERPIIIIEGEEDIYSARKIHPNAIRGMLATIAVSYGIPILPAKTFRESAALLSVIARREQINEGRDFQMHSEKHRETEDGQQEYVVSSLPGIGADLARELLCEFGTVGKVFSATEEELKKVNLIGDKKARAVRKIIEEEYKGASKGRLLQ